MAKANGNGKRGRPFLSWAVVSVSPWGEREVRKVVSKHATRDEAIERAKQTRSYFEKVSPEIKVTTEKRD